MQELDAIEQQLIQEWIRLKRACERTEPQLQSDAQVLIPETN